MHIKLNKISHLLIEIVKNAWIVCRNSARESRAGFTYGQDWAVAQGPPQPGGLHIFHGKKL